MEPARGRDRAEAPPGWRWGLSLRCASGFPAASWRRALVGVAAALLVALAPGSASAFDLCGAAARLGDQLPRADRADPLVRTAMGVWRRVYTGFYAATARKTELFIVAPDARVGGEALPPYAAICDTGAVPRLYLTYGLLALLDERRVYDESFVALIIGHELGHRLRDFDRFGRWTAQRWDKELEEVADAHGAFLAAASGFSTRQLACDAAMDLFLATEAGVDQALRQGRKDALAEVLRTFDVYESLYDAAAALLFADDSLATALLSWVNGHMGEHAKQLGELLVLEALARMTGAIDEAKWLRKLEVPGAPHDHLRCMPVYPAHTALWDQVIEGRARSLRTRGTHPQLSKAERLLRKAKLLGASDLVVSSALACVAFYASNPNKAARALADARAALPVDAPQAVRAALDANGALIAWARWRTDNPPPAPDAPAADQAAWAKALRVASRDLRAHPQLKRWLQRLSGYPTVAPARPDGGDDDPVQAVCGGRAPQTGPGPSVMPPLAEVPRSGGCPCGWTELHLLTSEIEQGRIQTCAPAGWAIGMRWVHMVLPHAQIDRRLLLHDGLRGPLTSLAAWRDGCDKLLLRGVSEKGERVLVGRCGGLGAEEAVLLSDATCRVQRAVVVGPNR